MDCTAWHGPNRQLECLFFVVNFAEVETVTCHDALNGRGLTCPASATFGPDYSTYDGISSISDTELVQNCCRMTCEEEMNSISPQIICTDGVPGEEWEHADGPMTLTRGSPIVGCSWARAARASTTERERSEKIVLFIQNI